MKPRPAVIPLALALACAAPANASAATVAVTPVKACYRSGEVIGFGGSGFTPGRGVSLTSDGRSIGNATADGTGSFAGSLRVAIRSGERVKTYTATDQANFANTASAQLRVSVLAVSAPSNAPPGRRLRISARGFTTGRTLYAHIVRGRYRRNVRIGRLRGACRKLRVRRRLIPSSTPNGSYVVQFDTRRRYSSRTAVSRRYSYTVFR